MADPTVDIRLRDRNIVTWMDFPVGWTRGGLTMGIRMLAAAAVAAVVLAQPASALPLQPVGPGAGVVLVHGGHGHGHGHAHGNHGRHLGWYIGRHRGWSHSHHRMH
jgi:hypothetical protein